MSDRREREREAIRDAHYEAWRHGQNPDRVDEERVRDDVDAGYQPYECAEREVHRLAASQHREPEEQEWPEEEPSK